MPKVSQAARATVKDGAVWRTCPTCQRLAAMAPDALFCDTCAATPNLSQREGSWTR